MATDIVEMTESIFVSMRPAVEFLDVLDQYSYNEDLECTFKFNDYTPQEGDRVAIYKLGWSFVKDYVVFEWVPVGSTEKQHHVIFNKHILPKNNNEIYQICYISGENVLHGASSPFQFCDNISQVTPQSIPPVSIENPRNATRLCLDTEQELKKLREENALLRASLQAILNQRTGAVVKNYDEDIKELRKVTDSLRMSLAMQQKEMNVLKTKIVEGGEEYKKLYVEKLKIERKFDKLKGKVDEDVKPVSSMVNFDIGDLKSIPPFPFAK